MVSLIQGSKPKNLRSHNIKAVLSLLWQEKALTIRDISQHVSLSSTTTNKILTNLMSEGIVVSVGKGASTSEGGKCPEQYSLNGSYCYFIVCSLTFSSSQLVLLDLTARVVDQVGLFPDAIANHAYHETVDEIARKTTLLLERNQLSSQRMFRLIISAGGIADPMGGIIRDAFVNSWDKNRMICDDVAHALSDEIPVYLDHVNVFIGYGESLLVPAYRQAYWVLLKEDGTCVFNHMEPVRGSTGYTGSFNMMVLDASRCDITKRIPGGNFTSLVNEEALLKISADRLPEFPQSMLSQKISDAALIVRDVFQAADMGDELACRVLDDIIYWFYIECYNLIVLYNPEKIIIQGLYRKAGNYFIERLRELAQNFPSYEEVPPYEIHYASESEMQQEAPGAVLFAFQHFFIESF